jgi:peptidoglycan/xylan/chitin deacetylase (PgdA/CDA1 family)
VRAILTYHSIDDGGSVLSVAPAIFRSHVAWLASGRARVVPLSEISDPSADGDAIALTFDDGLESFASHVWPLLREHGLPATVFVVTDRVGSTNAWGPTGGHPRRALLDWTHLRRLSDDGAVIGSHSRTHPSLPILDDARLADEVAGSSERIRAELGVTPAAFAYPYGDYDARSLATVASCYRLACTTDLRPLGADDDVHALPRLDAFYLRRPGAIERWGSAVFLARLRVRAAARNLRRALRSDRLPARRR